MKNLLLAALLALPVMAHADETAPSAHADQTRMSKTDGNKLLTVCTAKAPNLVQGCEAFIDGVADTVGVYQHEAEAPNSKTAVADRICVPGNATGVQLRDTVTEYLKAHPADRSHFAALIVQHALHDAYPCH